MTQKGFDTTFVLCDDRLVLPDFDKSGLLPPGIHWATFEEIKKRFGINAHRKRLLGGLAKGLAALKKAGCKAVYLDGSFVTARSLPKDYDACWEMQGVTVSNLDPAFLSSPGSRALQLAKFYGEFFPAYQVAEGPPFFRFFLNFFQVDKETGISKGIVGIKLDGKYD